MSERTDIVMIATGEYSDYATTPYKVLRPFTFAEAFKECVAQFKPDKWQDDDASPRPEQFESWLVTQGYIEQLDAYEVHVGSYGKAEFSENGAEMLLVQFAPLEAV